VHTTTPVIEATGLRKHYGDVVAVDDVSLRVERGEIFGILGPNGAGKTTSVEMVQGLRTPDAGTVRVLGLDPGRDGRVLRQRVGTQLQSAVLPDRMRVREALELYASYYEQAASVDQLLADWDLVDKQRAAFDSLSGGQRQRLFIALALVGDPEVVFLDELTTGLDPAARRATWAHVRRIRDAGVTVVLVTHFMDEAEQLCDRIAVIDGGRIVATDTPAGLTTRVRGSQTVRFSLPGGFDPTWLSTLDSVVAVDVDRGPAGESVVVLGDGPVVTDVATALAAHDVRPHDLSIERVTLEDAFLAITASPGDDRTAAAA
jgi:ABC-2 type transport system ATP-binding protein